MGNLRACLSVALLALAACGDDGGSNNDAGIVIIDASPDAKEFMDAPPPTFDFSCMGNAAPTTANAQVTLSGTVQQVDFNGGLDIVAVADADIEACDATAANCAGQDSFGTTTTANDGTFTLGPLDTGSAPLDAYLTMTKTATRSAYVYPAQPFTADQGNIPVLTFTGAALNVLGALGCDEAGGNGMIGLAVTDCADAPITDTANLMLSVQQNGAEVTTATVLDLGSLQPEAAGTFIICDVPANADTTVGATYNGMALRAHNVRVVAGATTSTLLRPGY